MTDYVRTSYNKICQRWSDFRKNTVINKCVADFVEFLKPGSRVLDVGCGTGYPVSAYLDKNGFDVTGLDVSEEMIKAARKLNLSNATFYVKDILDFETQEKYDAVIAFDSLWHIAYAKQERIYRIISSLMNPDGYFLFTHGKRNDETTGEMFGEKFYYSSLDVKKVQCLLKENGFDILTCIEDYQEKTSGSRELLVVAKKVRR